MADPEALEILKQGVDVWNKWRKENPGRAINLERADLRKISLSQANLREANLRGADLIEANLCAANLIEANLIETNLRGANLSFANLFGANLIEANLFRANLGETNLRRANLIAANLVETGLRAANLGLANLGGANLYLADLRWANLGGANLYAADLKSAAIAYTLFAHVDLTETKGLEQLRAWGPSSVDHQTLVRSENLPENFLRACGLPEPFIENLPALIGSMDPIQFHSCFISYSSKDDTFARRLHADLTAKGVRCFFAPEDLKIGEKIRLGIDRAIQVHDKLLLILSEESVKSDWVEKEVETAFAKERKRKQEGEEDTVLFPIRLDKTVMDTEEGWAADIRNSRNIGDFSNWTDPAAYEKSLDRLFRDLKAESEKHRR